MNKKLQKLWLLAIMLMVGVTGARAVDYTELFTVNSADVVSNSSYAAYSKTVDARGWVITFGGNNKSVGTNSGNRSKCKLTSYSKYAVSPVTTSDIAAAFASTSSISNVSKISYTVSGGSNQGNTNVYLIYSADGTTFSQVPLTSGTQGAALSSGTAFEFNECSGYFALLLECTNSSGNWRIDDLNITFYEAAGSTPTKTLESISVSGTAEDIWSSDEFTHNGITVTANWDDDTHTDVTDAATYSGYDMRHAYAGEQTVTVTYQDKQATYPVTLRTIYSDHTNPYTIDQAKALIDAGKGLNETVVVRGIISQIDSYSSTYHTITYWISEDGTTNNQFQVFGGKYEGMEDFESIDNIEVGAIVLVDGKIKKYGDVYEFDSGNYIYSYTPPTVTKYDVTIAPMTNGIVTSSVSEAKEGATVTLTVTPAAHYTLATLSVVGDESGDPVEVTNSKFTMPAEAVTVSATFSELPKYTVLYGSLGQEVSNEEVYAGECAANIPTALTNVPEGWELAGWTEDDLSKTTTAPTFFTATTPVNDDMILNAVFKKTVGGGSNAYVKVTEEPADWSGEYLLVYEDDNITWTGVDAGQCHVDVTIENGEIAEKPETASTLTIASMEGGYSIMVNGGDNDGQYIGKSANSNGIDFSDDAVVNTLSLSGTDVVITAAGGCTMRYNSNAGSSNERFRYYKSGQKAVQLYKYASSSTTYYTTDIYQRTVTDGNWGTYCAAKNVAATDFVGVKPYKLVGKKMDGDDLKCLVLEEMEDTDVLPAASSCIFRANSNTLEVTYTSETGNVENWGLIGDVNNEQNVEAGMYVINNNTVRKVGASATVKVAAGRAYIDLGWVDEYGDAISTGRVVFLEGEGTTGIKAIILDKDSKTYDLQGRRVNNTSKSQLYINNGKKVLF